LIKNYDLDVHYHPGKANVVTDVLSHKVHFNYLPAMRLTGEESITRVLPDLSSFKITLTTILKSEIITVQKNDEGIGHIKRRMQEGNPKVVCFPLTILISLDLPLIAMCYHTCHCLTSPSHPP
jgi:hypothetical protein